jgi:purine nucleosidase
MKEAETDALFARTPRSTIRDFSQALVLHTRGLAYNRGRPGDMRYVDPLAAAVVVDPSMISKSIKASTSVELSAGICRGMTLVDPSGRLGTPKITFVEEVDIEKIDKLYAVSVAYSPTNKQTN